MCRYSSVLRRRATEEREKGHTVKLGFLKFQVNRRWEYHTNETSENYQRKQIMLAEQQVQTHMPEKQEQASADKRGKTITTLVN